MVLNIEVNEPAANRANSVNITKKLLLKTAKVLMLPAPDLG